MRPASPTTLSDPTGLPVAESKTQSYVLLRYSSVAASVAVAALVRIPLYPVLGNKVAFITLFPAIVYSAWIAGLSGGLIATLLSALAATWFIIAPTHTLEINSPADRISLVVFVIVDFTISILGQAQHRAQQQAESSAREAEHSAARQRTFLHDVLLSVTDGRLALCHLRSDLPNPLPVCGDTIAVSRTSGIAELRGQAKQAALARGFADVRWHDLMTATSEAAMNAAVHGGGGQGHVCGNADTIQVWVEDEGMGIDIENLPQATLEKGFSSAGTLGHGMKLMLSTVDRVWLLTGTTGTIVVLEQARLPRVPKWLGKE